MLNSVAAFKTITLNCKRSETSRALERCSSQARQGIGQDQGWNPWVSHSGSLGSQSKKITSILLAEKASLVFREYTKRVTRYCNVTLWESWEPGNAEHKWGSLFSKAMQLVAVLFTAWIQSNQLLKARNWKKMGKGTYVRQCLHKLGIGFDVLSRSAGASPNTATSI